MRLITKHALWLIVGLLASVSVALCDDFSADGPHKVGVIQDSWTDAARAKREIPYKIYYPEDLGEPAPVVIFSHGLGGSCDGYSYIGKHLASHGYIVVHVTHAGSDTRAMTDAVADGKTIGEALKSIAADPKNLVNRPKDISFAIDQVIEMNKPDGRLKGLVDTQHIGVDGHSFGAYTVMAVAGETFPRKITFGDKRIKAAIAMSPPGKLNPKLYDSITIPVFIMTGTADNSPIGSGGDAADRAKLYDLLTGCPHYLLVFDGGDHMVFSGRGGTIGKSEIPGTGGDRSKDAGFQSFVKAATLEFFDAYLKNDASAKKWLVSDDGAAALLGKMGTWKHQEK